MYLSLKFKANAVTGSSKQHILSKIKTTMYYSFVHTYGSYGNFCSARRNDNLVRLYSIQKHRKVVTRVRKNNKTISTVVSPAHWSGHYYDVPYDVIKAICDTQGVKFVQGNRTYSIVKK